MTIFALPDHLINVNLVESNTTFDTSYIERVLFLVLDVGLPSVEYKYIADVTSSTVLPGTTAQVIVDNYFYKENLKSCDVLIVKDKIMIETLLSQLEQDTINDRTFTVSVDLNIEYPLVDFAFFKGVIQYSSNTFVDAKVLLDTTMLLHKITAADIPASNAENAMFASWFVNRINFFNPPGQKSLDYTYDEAGTFDVLTTEDLNIARTNNMTYFSSFNGLSYCAGYNVGADFNIIPYYEEKISRAVQEALFLFITGTTNFYTQENLNKATTIALKAAYVYSVAPYGFVNQEGTYTSNLVLADIPAADIQAGILRMTLYVSFFSIIRQIIINIPITQQGA